jgi:cob(I)alamin adenosyltransferase
VDGAAEIELNNLPDRFELTNPVTPMQIETPPTEKRYDKPEGERRGLVIVNTGDGKGKSTAAFGLALRAHGRGKAVKIYQFMKVPTARFGEHRMFEQIGLPIEGLGDGFSWKSQDLEHSAQLARDGWEKAAPPSCRASTFWWCWTRSPTR